MGNVEKYSKVLELKKTYLDDRPFEKFQIGMQTKAAASTGVRRSQCYVEQGAQRQRRYAPNLKFLRVIVIVKCQLSLNLFSRFNTHTYYDENTGSTNYERLCTSEKL